MKTILRRALGRLRGTSPLPVPPLQRRSTYSEPANQWYFPPVAGPASFLPDVAGAEPVTLALNVLEVLSRDAYLDFVRNFYKAGLANIGPTWVYADINTVLMGLARRLCVESYLEIGVRRGRSMAMVASQVPDCRIVGFDMWVDYYAGMENPGPARVREELQRVGYAGSLEFVDGDSKETVPAYFAAHPSEYFDLITVDGDHSTDGARRDLQNVIRGSRLAERWCSMTSPISRTRLLLRSGSAKWKTIQDSPAIPSPRLASESGSRFAVVDTFSRAALSVLMTSNSVFEQRASVMFPSTHARGWNSSMCPSA